MATPVKKKIRRSKEPCYFCVNMKEPDYKDIEVLSKYCFPTKRAVNTASRFLNRDLPVTNGLIDASATAVNDGE